MKEQEKANELYSNSVKLHGIDNAKEESIKSAKATLSLIPIDFRDGKLKIFWEKVIKYLEQK